jgi:hypothetical protein
MRTYLIIGMILCLQHLNAQTTDSSIYTSGFERNIFSKFLKDSSSVRSFDFLVAFQYNASSDEIEKKIAAFITELEKKGFHKLTRKKQLKEIYTKVHAHFLKKYNEETYFHDIFTSGNYNCVTASALYSLVLDHFKIDYVIKEKPNHVFIIADPKSTSFMIETTNPVKGFYQFDERFKKNYVDYLQKNKIISEIEYKSTSIDVLFEKYYESAKTISSLQLAALQYYNKGIFSFNSKDYSISAKNFEKAITIYPSPNMKFLYNSALVNLLIEQSGTKKYDGKTLAQYVNLNLEDHEAIQLSFDHFKSVTTEMVINRPDIGGYNRFYKEFTITLNNLAGKTEYDQYYHQMLAYYYHLKNNHEKVLFHAGKAYEINPDNIQNQQFVKESIFRYLQNLETETFILDTLIQYSYRFPFLLSEDIYLKILANGFTSDIAHYNSNVSKNELIRTITLLQQYCRKLLNSGATENTVEYIYSEASATLVRNYQYDEGEAILKNGLELLPGSQLLKTKLTTISKSKKELKNFMNTAYVNSAPVQQANLIKPPVYKEDEVHASAKKYLVKCWNADYFKKDGKTKETKVEQLKFIFQSDGTMKFRTGTDEQWGTWKLVASGPVLEITSNEDKQKLRILIYEATATRILGIVSPYKNENKKIELNVCDK